MIQYLVDGYEEFDQACTYCGKPVELKWFNGLLPGNYVLIADVVYHLECWDKQIEEHPPDEKPANFDSF